MPKTDCKAVFGFDESGLFFTSTCGELLGGTDRDTVKKAIAETGRFEQEAAEAVCDDCGAKIKTPRILLKVSEG